MVSLIIAKISLSAAPISSLSEPVLSATLTGKGSGKLSSSTLTVFAGLRLILANIDDPFAFVEGRIGKFLVDSMLRHLKISKVERQIYKDRPKCTPNKL
jgi:hypothetical protein